MSTTTKKVTVIPGSLIGENVYQEMEGSILHLRIETKRPGSPSASGKSMTVASTRGNIFIAEANASLGLNFYRKA